MCRPDRTPSRTRRSSRTGPDWWWVRAIPLWRPARHAARCPSTVAVGAGDYIGLGGRLYIATAAVAASGAGTATIAIAPPLRAAVVVGEPLILSLPSVPMRLVSDDEAANPTRPGPFAAVTIRLEEAL